MNTLKEVLRLKYLGRLSNRKVQLFGLTSKSAVSNYITAFKKSKLTIDEALSMEDDALSYTTMRGDSLFLDMTKEL